MQPNGLIVLRQLSWAIPLQKEDSLITFVILRRGEEVAHVRATAKSLLRDSTIISSEGLREVRHTPHTYPFTSDVIHLLLESAATAEHS